MGINFEISCCSNDKITKYEYPSDYPNPSIIYITSKTKDLIDRSYNKFKYDNKFNYHETFIIILKCIKHTEFFIGNYYGTQNINDFRYNFGSIIIDNVIIVNGHLDTSVEIPKNVNYIYIRCKYVESIKNYLSNLPIHISTILCADGAVDFISELPIGLKYLIISKGNTYKFKLPYGCRVIYF